MAWEWLIGAVVATALLLYLGFVLIWPERF